MNCTFPHPSRLEHELFGGYHLRKNWQVKAHSGSTTPDALNAVLSSALACVCSPQIRVPSPCGNVFGGYLGRPTSGPRTPRATPRRASSRRRSRASPHLSSSSRAAAPCSRARVYPGRRGAAASSSSLRLDAWRCCPPRGRRVRGRRAAPRRGGGDDDDEERENGDGDDDGDAPGRGMRRWRRFCRRRGRVVVAFASCEQSRRPFRVS